MAERLGLWGKVFDSMNNFNDYLRSSLKMLLMGRFPKFNDILPSMGTKVAFVNCNVFDGESSQLQSNMTILVEGDRISAVAPAATISVPETFLSVDVEGKTVLPGLIDSHVHLCSPFTYDVNLPAIRQMRQQITFNNLRTIDSGVTTVCDMGGPQGIIKEFKNLVDSNVIPGPRSLNCFTLISPRKGKVLGYPPQVKLVNPFQSWLLEGQIATRPKTIRELRRVCYKVKDDGGTHLKTTYQAYPFSAKKPDPAQSLPLFSPDWMKELFRISKETGLVVSIHCPYAGGAEACVNLAIEVGAQIRIQHVSFDEDLNDSTLQKMQDYGFYLIPTVMVYGDAFRMPGIISFLNENSEGCLTQEARKQLKGRIQKTIDLEPQSGQEVLELDNVYFREQFDVVRRNTQKAHSAGIIGFGTDLGGTYTGLFGRLLSEVQHYSEFGIPSHDILKYLTSVNAKINNLGDRGTLRAGNLADILVVDGNPLQDIMKLGEVRAVMKGGVFLKYDKVGQSPS